MGKSILVGDIGSTKSTWWYLKEQDQVIRLTGFNPLVHTHETGRKLFEEVKEQTSDIEFSEIWYYGTGVIDQNSGHEITSILKPLFPESLIHVNSDLVGACIAACGPEAGAVAILGTGSHAAVFDGHKILRQATSLGYILGDEGGGCDLGKTLLQSYFYNEMPEMIHQEMDALLPQGRVDVLNNLRTSPHPNQYLAEFARVAVLYQDHPWIKDIVSSRFKLFVNRHIGPLSVTGPVHIVGSIGCIFAGLIQQELENNGLTAGTFIRDPGHRLFEIHMEYGR